MSLLRAEIVGVAIVRVLALVAVGWYLLVHLHGVRRIFRRAGRYVGEALASELSRIGRVYSAAAKDRPVARC